MKKEKMMWMLIGIVGGGVGYWLWRSARATAATSAQGKSISPQPSPQPSLQPFPQAQKPSLFVTQTPEGITIVPISTVTSLTQTAVKPTTRALAVPITTAQGMQYIPVQIVPGPQGEYLLTVPTKSGGRMVL